MPLIEKVGKLRDLFISKHHIAPLTLLVDEITLVELMEENFKISYKEIVYDILNKKCVPKFMGMNLFVVKNAASLLKVTI